MKCELQEDSDFVSLIHCHTLGFQNMAWNQSQDQSEVKNSAIKMSYSNAIFF